MQIEIRKANENDSPFLFELRNQPSTYQYAKNPRLVEWQEHIDWLEPILKGETQRHLFIIEFDGQKAGQTRIDIEDKEAEVNISLMPEFQGQGIAFVAIEKAMEKISQEQGVKIFRAHVHQDNIASQKLFEKLGYQIETQEDVWIEYVL